MTDPGIFKYLVTAQAVWKDAGWGIIVFLAALSAVNTTCTRPPPWTAPGRWRRMWHVTLPALRPVIALLLVLRVGDALTVGFEQFLLQRDAVGPGASEVLDTYVWWNGIAQPGLQLRRRGRPVQGRRQPRLVLTANKVGPSHGRAGGVQEVMPSARRPRPAPAAAASRWAAPPRPWEEEPAKAGQAGKGLALVLACLAILVPAVDRDRHQPLRRRRPSTRGRPGDRPAGLTFVAYQRAAERRPGHPRRRWSASASPSSARCSAWPCPCCAPTACRAAGRWGTGGS